MDGGGSSAGGNEQSGPQFASSNQGNDETSDLAAKAAQKLAAGNAIVAPQP